MTNRIYLFLFLLVFFFLVFVIRSFILWKNTGINPITFDKTDDAHGFNGKVFKFISGLELIVIAIYAFGGDLYQYLLPFWYLENPDLQFIGWGLLIFSLIWIFIAQSQMANSWRIGIDEKNKTELKTGGLFAVSRNPIFLGILIAGLGLFLVVPNAFILLITGLSFTSVHTQVRLEEVFLKKTHGKEYETYCRKVRRWL